MAGRPRDVISVGVTLGMANHQVKKNVARHAWGPGDDGRRAGKEDPSRAPRPWPCASHTLPSVFQELGGDEAVFLDACSGDGS
jgi:hypothetical protein